jgi:hypothetical protein
LVDAQSAIRYFNSVLAFARNINAPHFMVGEMRLLPIERLVGLANEGIQTPQAALR